MFSGYRKTKFCNRCSYCLEGRANLCENRMVLGVSCGEYRRHGAMAEYVAVPQAILAKMPDSMTFHQAAMIEPVSIAYHAVERARVSLNATAAVVGCGMIGLFVLQLRVVLIGNWAPEISLPLQVVVTGEIDVLGSCASNRDFPDCVDLIASGRVHVDSLISGTAPLSEGGRWFQTLLEAREPLFKIILEP